MIAPIWSRKLVQAAPLTNRRPRRWGELAIPWPAPSEHGRREVPSMLCRSMPSVIALSAVLWISPE
jgi:hypothetical protein